MYEYSTLSLHIDIGFLLCDAPHLPLPIPHHIIEEVVPLSEFIGRQPSIRYFDTYHDKAATSKYPTSPFSDHATIAGPESHGTDVVETYLSD